MHVRVRCASKPEAIILLTSKLSKIDELREHVRERLDVKPDQQRLFYGGKMLENGYTLHDYNIRLNDVIQLMTTTLPLTYEKNKSTSDTKCEEKKKYTDAKSTLYQKGDIIEMRCLLSGSWCEGKISSIFYNPDEPMKCTEEIDKKLKRSEIVDGDQENNSHCDDKENKIDKQTSPNRKNNITHYFFKTPNAKTDNGKIKSNKQLQGDEDLIYEVLLKDGDYDFTTPYNCKLNQIRPRSRRTVEVSDIVINNTYLINHNMDMPNEKGLWFDFKVLMIKKERSTISLIGTLYEVITHNDYEVNIVDSIYEIEDVVPLSERNEKLMKLMATDIPCRAGPLKCETCRDKIDQPCKDCGCFLCAGKEKPGEIILCDECDNGFHFFCLTPPLKDLPEDDWYCPDCKRDPNEVIAPGGSKQTKKSKQGQRDWGRGFACVGKTQTCAMPANHFGPIPGVEVGMQWKYRIQLSENGVHRPPVSGIHGKENEGAYSLVLSGGYEDDVDNGFEFTYTGSGGRDLSGNKRTAQQSCNQTLTRQNKALAKNCACDKISEEGGDAANNWRKGKPVRVVRSYKLTKHSPKYAPEEGLRYDGVYKVVKFYPETGKSGFVVWKYLLRRDDPSPAPWEKNAKKYSIVYPDGFLEAEALKQANNDKSKLSKKRVKPDNDFDNQSPPMKRRKNTKLNKLIEGSTTIDENPFNVSSERNPSLDNSIEEGPSPSIILNEDELKCIDLDTLNKKLWDECTNKCKTKKDFINKVTEAFLCIICQDVAANPITTKCQHNFCLPCIKCSFTSTGSQNCPYCRQELTSELKINQDLKNALRLIMPGYDAGKNK